MSFNLNKLVQPECGAPNPLVSAAQRIVAKPGTSMNLARFRHHPNSAPVNFSAEFIQHKTSQDSLSQPGSSQMSKISTINSKTNYTYNNYTYMHPYAMGIPQHSTQITKHIVAGDQLETKYRDDMIASASQTKQGLKEKTDDVEFWQALSQKYVGPSVDTTVEGTKHSNVQTKSTLQDEVDNKELNERLEATDTYEDAPFNISNILERTKLNEVDLEYVFDERNPLKDQYEDPFAEGLKKLEQGDIPSAALLFEASVQLDPQNSTAWRYLGTTQAQNEKDVSAIKALRNCLKLNDKDQEARLAISVSLANETQHHEACKHLLQWLINHEKYRSINASLEEFHRYDDLIAEDPFSLNSVDTKHYSYVRDKFVEAARLSPNNPDPEVQCSLGVIFNMRGEYDKAVDCFKAALSVRADDSLLWNRLGATLANGNKSDEAVIAYRKALEISPGFLRSRYNLAISLVHLNTYTEAGKQLVQILNMQAAGKGSKNPQIRTRSITSGAIWSTLRTVATLMNKPELYPMIEGRDLAKCNDAIFKLQTS